MKKHILFVLSVCLFLSPLQAEDNIETLMKEAIQLEKIDVKTFKKTSESFIFIGGGSGVCISADGYILTNQHVCAEKDDWVVHDIHGKAYQASVIGRDTKGDIALLKINAVKKMAFAKLAKENSVIVGQKAYAVGDPFKLGMGDFIPSVTLGIVSGVDLYMEGGFAYTYSDAVQTDAAVNPGNSGGPLFNKAGEIIGINGQIRSNGIRANRGIGLAISSDRIKRILPKLKNAKGGIILHGYIMGINIDEVEDEKIQGLEIKLLKAGSLAERKGLLKGDVIVKIGKQKIKSYSQYLNVITALLPNTGVDLHILRKKKTVVINYKIDAMSSPPKNFGPMQTPQGYPTRKRPSMIFRTGFSLLPHSMHIVKTEDGGPAKAAGLRKGDEVTEIDGQSENLKKVLKKLLNVTYKDYILRDSNYVNITVKRKIKGSDLTYNFKTTMMIDIAY
jgi:S1-C subfamily serine protease